MKRNKKNNTNITAVPHWKVITVTAVGVALLFAVSWAVGCVRYEPAISGTPTPTASPTPLPDPFTAEITAAPVNTDKLGRVIETEDHYYRYYLSFGDLRVYEYETGTFLDGVVVNAFPTALKGEVYIVFRNAQDTVVGKGLIHLADGETAIPSGTNNIYAEIVTDITVQDMDFTLEVTTPFQPVEE